MPLEQDRYHAAACPRRRDEQAPCTCRAGRGLARRSEGFQYDAGTQSTREMERRRKQELRKAAKDTDW